MFTQIEKTKFGNGSPTTGKVRVRSKGVNDKSCSVAFGSDVLGLIGAKHGDRLDILVGTDADLGKVAFRVGSSAHAYKLTSNGDSKKSSCVNVPTKSLSIEGVVGTSDIPWWIEGGMIVASLVALQSSLRAKIGAAA